MRLPNPFRTRYTRVPSAEDPLPASPDSLPLSNLPLSIINPDDNEELPNDDLPPDPPAYEATGSDSANTADYLSLEEQPQPTRTLLTSSKLSQFIANINTNIVSPVKSGIVDPLVEIYTLMSHKLDFYLNKVGNPVILRRFFYIIMVTVIMWSIVSSGLLPVNSAPYLGGLFSNHDMLLQYARDTLDLSKLERDLEYISSMPHLSGTKGDTAIRKYIVESFTNNRLKLIRELEFLGYSNYPGSASLAILKGIDGDDSEIVNIELNENNFNALSVNGELKGVKLIYGNKGTEADLKTLKENGLLDGDYALLLDYDTLVSEQMMLAMRYNARAVLFRSEKLNANDGDVIQQRSVALPQFGSGDILTPGWTGDVLGPISPEDASSIPHIPSLPLSFNQAQQLLNALGSKGVEFSDGLHSGNGDVRINLKVETAIRETQPVLDIIGKIEGKEQAEKAIIIAATRSSTQTGAMYPNFGTALLLSLVQILQEMKFKYGWKPLRSIYFVSFGGAEYNYAGSTELIEQRLASLKNEIYTFVDISQLGIWDNDSSTINIQTHPLLRAFFENETNKMGLNLDIEQVTQYGDWIPFAANGIPVSVFSSPSIRARVLPIDTNYDTFDNVKDILRNPDNADLISSLMLYVAQVCLKLTNTPLIPFDIDDYVGFLQDKFAELDRSVNGRLDFEAINEAIGVWRRIGMEWTGWVKTWEQLVLGTEGGIEPSLISVQRWTWNKKLSLIGRRQCDAAGLDGRSFYKNVLFSPPLWTDSTDSDKGWVFPGIRDAIHDGDWNAAQEALNTVAKVLKLSADQFIEETNDVGY